MKLNRKKMKLNRKNKIYELIGRVVVFLICYISIILFLYWAFLQGMTY